MVRAWATLRNAGQNHYALSAGGNRLDEILRHGARAIRRCGHHASPAPLRGDAALGASAGALRPRLARAAESFGDVWFCLSLRALSHSGVDHGRAAAADARGAAKRAA